MATGGRAPTWRGTVARLIVALLVGTTGVLLLGDRPGLGAEYFANSTSWEGTPVYTGVAEPSSGGPEDLAPVFLSMEAFSVRWRGWMTVGESGDYELTLTADGGSYWRLDGETVVETEGVRGRFLDSRQLFLERGVHAIEVGLRQAGDKKSRLRTLWAAVGGEAEPLPAESLHARRPVWLYSALRRMAPIPVPYRRLLGSLLLLAGLLTAAGAWRVLGPKVEPPLRRLRGWLEDPRARRAGYAALLLGLFLVTWAAAMPYTVSTSGGDDVRYLEAAAFDKKIPGYLNRYAHVYLVKLFSGLRGGDVFLGARTYWSFLFAVTVASLALAVRSLGPRLQLGTFAVALFLLLSQPSILFDIGVTFPDYTAMMFVTAGVAIYLHGAFVRGGPGRREWHAAAIGALTVAAVKSKETAIILTWLPMLFLWTEGRVDLKRFARRMRYWLLGALGAYLVLMALDAWLLGDLWFSLRPENLRAVREVNFAREVLPSRRTAAGWLHLVLALGAGRPSVEPVLRNLWVLAAVAAFVSAARGRRIELRLLHLMPFAYLLLMMVLHVRGTYIFTPRYLLPILPICCLAGAALFLDAGPERESRRMLSSPRFHVPLFLAAALVLLVVNPFRMGRLEAADLVPGRTLAELGWTAENFLRSTAGPALLLLGLALAALVWTRRGARVWVLALALLLFFGPGVETTRGLLARHISKQRGELILYPWRTFREQIQAGRPDSVAVSPQLFNRYRMVGQFATREGIARVFFGRADLRVPQVRDLTPEVDYAIASRGEFQRWRRQVPGLESTAIFDPTRQIVLVRPRAAAIPGPDREAPRRAPRSR